MFQVTFYPEGTIKKIQLNGKFFPIFALTKDGNKKIKLGKIIKFGFQYSFCPAIDNKEGSLLRINFDCSKGIYLIQGFENDEI